MRVGYIFPFDVTRAQGLVERLEERIPIWVRNGVDVELFVCAGLSSESATRLSSLPCPVHVLTGRSAASASWGLRRAVRERGMDILYCRYGLPYPGLIRVARELPTILEIHADDMVEAKFRPYRYRATAALLGGSLFRSVSGAVFVDPDLEKAQRYQAIKGPRLSLANGIRIDERLDYGGPRTRSSGRPRLVFAVGANEVWQGTDKLLELARLAPSLDFHIVGSTTSQEKTPANVWVHDRRDSADFDTFLAGMDVGVGSLAVERVGRPRCSPLKVRTYIRGGLPIVIAHHDPDIAENRSVLNLGYGFEPNLAAARTLVKFVENVIGRNIDRSIAQAVSADRKEQLRVTYLGDIFERERSYV